VRKRRRPPPLVGSPADTWLDAPRRGSLSGGCYQAPSLRVHWKPRHVVATDRSSFRQEYRWRRKVRHKGQKGLRLRHRPRNPVREITRASEGDSVRAPYPRLDAPVVDRSRCGSAIRPQPCARCKACTKSGKSSIFLSAGGVPWRKATQIPAEVCTPRRSRHHETPKPDRWL